MKETQFNDNENKSWIEGVIKGGVIHTEYGDWLDGDERLDEIIQNGVKETYDDAYHHKGRIDGVIKNGVKETLNTEYMLQVMVEDAIQNGIKNPTD